MRSFSYYLAATALVAIPSVVAAADQTVTRYFGVILGSAHIGSDNLNDTTPGLTFGRRTDRGGGRETHFEAGVFYNSYEEVSPLFLTGMTWSLGHIGPLEIRGGGSIGAAYYKELSHSLEADYGIPNVGGFIPVIGLSTEVRWTSHALRLTTVPPDKDTDFIFNMSYTHVF